MTGGRDAFNAGFLCAVLTKGFDPVSNVSAAHDLARKVLMSPGAGEGVVEGEGEDVRDVAGEPLAVWTGTGGRRGRRAHSRRT